MLKAISIERSTLRKQTFEGRHDASGIAVDISTDGDNGDAPTLCTQALLQQPSWHIRLDRNEHVWNGLESKEEIDRRRQLKMDRGYEKTSGFDSVALRVATSMEC